MSSPLILNVNRKWHFEIKPFYSLIMLFGIALCFIAAFWQYNKSQHYKEVVYEPVEKKGIFLDVFTHFLDNQTLNGSAGYAVLTPFAYEGKIYIVNRGFVTYQDRDEIPPIPDVRGEAVINVLEAPINLPFLLNDTLQDPISNRLQFIDTTLFSEKLNHQVEPILLLQQSGKGLLTAMPMKSPYLSHHRHQAYAVQWLLLAFCGVLILLIASLKRDRNYE